MTPGPETTPLACSHGWHFAKKNKIKTEIMEKNRFLHNYPGDEHHVIFDQKYWEETLKLYPLTAALLNDHSKALSKMRKPNIFSLIKKLIVKRRFKKKYYNRQYQLHEPK